MIKVIDSRCGSGKTSYIIDYINSLAKGTKVLYITPFLSETERIKKECSYRKFKLPDKRKGKGSKYGDLIRLIKKGENIASTHALFMNLDERVLSLLRDSNYILILDEAMNVVEKLYVYNDDSVDDEQKEAVTKNDIDTLIKKGFIAVDDDGLVRCITNKDFLSKYEELKKLIDMQLVYYLDKSTLVWTFPIAGFKEDVFKEIYILTYQFDCQIQSYYYKYFGLEYELYMVEDSGNRNYELKPYVDGYDIGWRKEIAKLITICDSEKLNEIGDYFFKEDRSRSFTALSKHWFEEATDKQLTQLKNNIYNYFRYETNSSSNQRLWTCYKTDMTNLKSANATNRTWLACGCRASNVYAQRDVLVYSINRYLNPFYYKFFSKKGIKVDSDKYALSEMIQWIFRSAIRNGEPINIYIPSNRMRMLLKMWLSGEF